MAFQLSAAVRNAILDAIETAVGASAKLELRTGAMPANCAAATTGTLVASMTLPADWMSAAAAGSKAKLGTWQDASADNAGTVGYFRIFDNAGTTCHMQGTVTITGGGGDMTLQAVIISAGQSITITTFTLTQPNS